MRLAEPNCRTSIWLDWDWNSPMTRRRKHLLFETELSWFILVGALDVFMTYLILRYSAEGRTRQAAPLSRQITGNTSGWSPIGAPSAIGRSLSPPGSGMPWPAGW